MVESRGVNLDNNAWIMIIHKDYYEVNRLTALSGLCKVLSASCIEINTEVST